MKKEQVSTEVKELILSKNQECRSVIIPLHHNPSQNQTDRLAVEHAIKNVRILLDSKYETPEREKWMEKVMGLKEQISMTNGWSGAGMFVSPGLSKLISFPVKVKEKIVMANSFEI